MMSLRTRLFIIISLVILIILGISIFLVITFGKKTVTPTPTGQDLTVNEQTSVVPDSNGSTVQIVDTPVNTVPVNISTEDIEKNTAKQLAKVFIERYGTYSTDNGTENVKEVKSLVVPALWTNLSAKLSTVEVNENQAPVGAFSSMSTQVFNMELNNWTQTGATIAMQLVRVEEKNGTRTTKHQNAEVNMVKQNGQWLVQNFKWL